MEALVLGIDNSLIPVEICTCNEIHKYKIIICTNLKGHKIIMSMGKDMSKFLDSFSTLILLLTHVVSEILMLLNP